jgi:hypothetical protein
MSTAAGLPSDYYFIDASIEGQLCETRPAPVMVINPGVPPVPGCVVNTSSMTESSAGIGGLEKTSFAPREAVKLNLGVQDLNGFAVTVALRDGLSNILDSASAGFSHLIRHANDKGPGVYGQLFTIRAMQQGQPVPGVEIMAGVKASQAVISRAVTDTDGRALLVFPQLMGNAQLFASVAEGGPGGITLQWEEEPGNQTGIPFPCLRLGEHLRADMESRLFNARITAGFQGEQTKAFDVSVRDTTDFYGKPDQRYWLDSYVRFPVMEEVMLEIIPPVKFRKVGDEQFLQVLNLPRKTFFDEPALVLVDGVPVPNNKKLLDLDPISVRCIDVMTRKYILGTTEFNGVVHFKTYSVNGPAPGTERRWQGLQEDVQYQGVLVSSNSQTMPEMRNLVFHDLKQKGESGELQFVMPDKEGDYQLRIIGLRGLSPVIQSAMLRVIR